MKQARKLYLFLLVIIIYSCHKEDDSPYYKFTQDVLDWGYYKQGSYWVYKNDSTGTFDSLIIDNSSLEIKSFYQAKSSHEPSYYEDNFLVRYKKNNFGIVYDYSQIDCNEEIGTLDRKNEDTASYPLIFWNCKNNINDVDTFNYIVREVLGSYPIFVVGLNSFQNVLCFKITDFNKNKISTFYIAKNIGMIKILTKDSVGETSYDLVEWNTIQ